MCCDGSLFGLVRLSSEDVARLTRLGLPVFSPSDHPALKQPCGALRDLACTIYDDRPERCAAYRCMLLDAYEADEVGLDEALGVVHEARALSGRERTAFVDLHFLGRARGGP